MLFTVLAEHTLRIEHEDDITAARRRVRDIAEARKFDTFATAAITTATSELARNIVVHAGKGVARIEEVSEGTGARYWKGSPEQRVGIRILFEDSGPGIADVARVLAGGFSTARSMGLGVSGSRRLVDDFTLESAPGEGTRVTILKWKRF